MAANERDMIAKKMTVLHALFCSREPRVPIYPLQFFIHLILSVNAKSDKSFLRHLIIWLKLHSIDNNTNKNKDYVRQNHCSMFSNRVADMIRLYKNSALHNSFLCWNLNRDILNELFYSRLYRIPRLQKLIHQLIARHKSNI